jgi:hypothetical protein
MQADGSAERPKAQRRVAEPKARGGGVDFGGLMTPSPSAEYTLAPPITPAGPLPSPPLGALPTPTNLAASFGASKDRPSLDSPIPSLNGTKCSLNGAKCSLNGAKSSLNDAKCFLMVPNVP